MSLAQPLVDPISVLVGAFSGGTGAVSISGLARSYASIPGRAITAGLQNDFRRFLSGFTTSQGNTEKYLPNFAARSPKDPWIIEIYQIIKCPTAKAKKYKIYSSKLCLVFCTLKRFIY